MRTIATPSSRRAAALPVVLLLMMVFGIMGVAFMGLGSGGYRQTALSSARLKLEEMVVSTLDEVRYRLYQNTSALGILKQQAGAVEPELRFMLLEELAAVQGDPARLEVSYDLRNALVWSQSVAGATDPDFELVEATAHFYGFRPILFSDDGGFPGESTPAGMQASVPISDYYQTIDGDEIDLDTFAEEDVFRPPEDLQGYCTVKVHLRLRGMERRISVTHDVKLVDARPPADKFALFAWRNTFGYDERMLAALNQGESKMAIYPQLVGRVHVKGPYVWNIEGHADGLGGGQPRPSASYPRDRPAWSGWSQVRFGRALRLEAWRMFQNDPTRPSEACINCSEGMGVSLGLGGGPTAVTDRAVFGVPQPYFTAAVGLGQQRFFLNGEPHATDPQREESRIPGLGSDSWRAPLVRVTGEGEDLKRELHVFTQDEGWTRDGEDGDLALVEPAGPLGLWRPTKYYRYDTSGCPRPDGSWWNPIKWIQVGAHYIRSAACFVGEVGSFGVVTARAYRRIPMEEPLPDVSGSNVEELTRRPAGVENQPPERAEEGQVFLEPFQMVYEERDTLSGWTSALNVGVNVLSAVLMVALPGPGTAAGLGLRAALQAGVRPALATAGRLAGRAIANPKTLGVMGVELAGAGAGTLVDDNRPTGAGSIAPTIVETIPPDANVIDPDEGDLDPEDIPPPATFDQMIWRDQHAGWKETTEKGSEVLYQLMSGDPTFAANTLSMDDYYAYRQLENNHLMNPREYFRSDIPYRGFLPADLKPYMRLAVAVYPDFVDLVGDGTRALELDGVTAVERLPQADDDFTANVRYVGRGVLFSSSRGNENPLGSLPADPNREPVFGGSITPLNRGQDYLTMVYWSGADPEQAGIGSGLGMLGLTQPQNEGTFVAPFGVRPLGEYTAIRGNLVTGFLDRHRFPSGTSLRVFYDWQLLAPELGETDPQEQQAIRDANAGRYFSVAVSPKVAGWYDYLSE